MALRLSPGHAEASLNRGLSWLALGDLANAVADFDRALDPRQARAITFLGPFSSRHPELYRARSEARRRLGDLDGALSDLDAAIGLDADDALARARRGHLHAARMNFAQAIADFDRAIALGRGDADVYKARGDARAAIGDDAGARDDHDPPTASARKMPPKRAQGLRSATYNPTAHTVTLLPRKKLIVSVAYRLTFLRETAASAMRVYPLSTSTSRPSTSQTRSPHWPRYSHSATALSSTSLIAPRSPSPSILP